MRRKARWRWKRPLKSRLRRFRGSRMLPLSWKPRRWWKRPPERRETGRRWKSPLECRKARRRKRRLEVPGARRLRGSRMLPLPWCLPERRGARRQSGGSILLPLPFGKSPPKRREAWRRKRRLEVLGLRRLRGSRMFPLPWCLPERRGAQRQSGGSILLPLPFGKSPPKRREARRRKRRLEVLGPRRFRGSGMLPPL
jgi:hypothetical protein